MATGPGERAVRLPGFCPAAASLDLLARCPGAVPWSAVQQDPGLLFFLLGRSLPITDAEPVRLSDADLCAAADGLTADTVPWADWRDPHLLPVTRTALAAAHYAELTADVIGLDPAPAWAGGWLAYAGWLAVGVIEPAAVTACRTEADFALDPYGSQARAWGRTRADIAWRLANDWPLPRWAGLLLGRLDATPEEAHQFGGDPRLHAAVQIACVLAEQRETRLFVADEFDLAAALAEVRLRSADLDVIRERYTATADPDRWLDRDWLDPRQDPDLADRLRQAVRDRTPPVVVALPAPDAADEEDVPVLAVDTFDRRVRDAKLAAVAEFAAGASHEINNPLAVISGQSEYLLKQEMADDRRQALQSIVRQTRRIHSLLTELMYFARPPAPRREQVDLGRLIRDAIAVVAPLAGERDVDLEFAGPPNPLWVEVDPRQMGIALTALVRNGVEAVPAGGWVRVASVFRPDRLDVIVEDSGPGPDERSQDHLFDPFYSGRSAGRGRGLGLPTAWRLAREHGGDVRYDPVPGGPTRFVLTLPGSAVLTGAQRKSA